MCDKDQDSGHRYARFPWSFLGQEARVCKQREMVLSHDVSLVLGVGVRTSAEHPEVHRGFEF